MPKTQKTGLPEIICGKSSNPKFLTILLLGVILLSILLLQIPLAPGQTPMGTDSGAFAYIGRRILEGDILYVDVFDHKPPGVYWINALALHLFGNSLWSIWLFQGLWNGLTALLFFLVIRGKMRMFSAFAGTLVLLFTLYYPDYYSSGNMTETYALFPQVMGLAAIAGFSQTGNRRWLVFLGVSAGIAFLFKPTYVGIGLAGSLAVGLNDIQKNEWRRLASHAACVLSGLLMPVLAVAIPASINGTLDELWYASIAFNLTYSRGGLSLRNMYMTARSLFTNPPLSIVNTLAAGAVGLKLTEILYTDTSTEQKHVKMGDKTGQIAGEYYPIFWTAVIMGLFIEWMLVFTSGRALGHYFITILPAAAATCTLLLDKIPELFHTAVSRMRDRAASSGAVICMILVLLAVWSVEVIVKTAPTPAQADHVINNLFDDGYERGALAEYLMEKTGPAEYVYIFDDHAEKYFLADRTSPTSILYASHLLLPGVDHEAVFDTLLRELENQPPRLILTQTQSGPGTPFLGSPPEELCRGVSEDACSGLMQLKSYVEDHYQAAETLGSWLIFEINQ